LSPCLRLDRDFHEGALGKRHFISVLGGQGVFDADLLRPAIDILDGDLNIGSSMASINQRNTGPEECPPPSNGQN
jgi:hypothetical protein